MWYHLKFVNEVDGVLQDLEGMQTMRNLALNFAWILKWIELGKNNGIGLPVSKDRVYTNFIR